MARKYLLFSVTAILVAALDLVTKAWVTGAIGPGQGVTITPFFNLVHVHNTGVSFSMLSNLDSGLRVPFLLGLSFVSMGFLGYLMKGADTRLSVFGLAAVFGGALGNIVDRIRLGHVVDFLHFHAGGFSWPVFNVADIGITIGVALVLLDGLVRSKGRESTAEAG